MFFSPRQTLNAFITLLSKWFALDGEAAGFGLGEGAGGVGIQAGPGFGVDIGLEGGFQGLVGGARAEEIGVAHEEGFFVVVGVQKPAGDAVGAGAAHFAAGGGGGGGGAGNGG